MFVCLYACFLIVAYVQIDANEFKCMLRCTSVLCLAACDVARHLSVLCSVGQLPTRTMQYWAAFDAHCLAFRIVYIIFILFNNHVYQNYIVS